MNYSLIVAVCSLAAGMIVTERWCSWRLGTTRRRGGAPDVRSPNHKAGNDSVTVSPEEDAEAVPIF